MKKKYLKILIIFIILIVLGYLAYNQLAYNQLLMAIHYEDSGRWCLSASTVAINEKKYACYDEARQRLYVTISHGSENFDLEGIKLSYLFYNSSYGSYLVKDKMKGNLSISTFLDNTGEGYGVIKIPKQSEEVTYNISLDTMPKEIRIAPLIKVKFYSWIGSYKKDKLCDITSKATISKCNLSFM